MPLSMNNSKDIVANSVSVIKGNRTIDVLETIDALSGLAPETLNSLETLATALNNDSNFFNTVSAALSNKADSITTYNMTTVNNLLDAKVDDTEMAAYAVKTEVTTALNTKQDTLTAGTASTGSQAILSGSTIKNIIPGTGMSLLSDVNGIVITGRDAYTKEEVNTNISSLVGTAPAILDTLQEISSSINNDANFSTTMINALANKATTTEVATKAPLASPALTGNATATNLTVTGNLINGTTNILTELGTKATTTVVATKAPLASPALTGDATAVNLSVSGNLIAGTTSILTELGTKATTTVVARKAPLASPALTGTATATNLTVTGNLIAGTTNILTELGTRQQQQH